MYSKNKFVFVAEFVDSHIAKQQNDQKYKARSFKSREHEENLNVQICLSTIDGFGAPEPCLLEDMGFTQEDIEPFGFDQEKVSVVRFAQIIETSSSNMSNCNLSILSCSGGISASRSICVAHTNQTRVVCRE
ncbi:unnamed protein product [Strongylus vulgaris]|uniref:Uncharacterized protein n=1 Tax=Strongylus vulgaris TaxID=40348 RepID=A0A3P7KAZ1_STRVU|nr:unnamed protein product [Strongylus vulgaris]